MGSGNWEQELESLGRKIGDIVDSAVNSQDFQRLNQTVTKAVYDAVDTGTDAVNRAVKNIQEKRKYTVEPPFPPKPRRTLYAGTTGYSAGNVVKTVFGGIFTLGFGITALVMGIGALVTPDPVFPILLGAFGLCTAASGTLLGSGIRSLSSLARFKTYVRLIGDKTQYKIEELSKSTQKSREYVLKDLQKMIGRGWFLEGHLDNERTLLITSNETYEAFENARLSLEAQNQERRRIEAVRQENKPQAMDPRVQEVLDKGKHFLTQIRLYNDRIPGEEISDKISALERVTHKIFLRAELHPEVIPELKKMMDYYLPMTVKLLNAYAEMDEHGGDGETIQRSKQEIEATLDTLNLAFEKLLDSVFKDTALDISSDISVLQTLLAQEGLTEDGLNQYKSY